MRLAARAGVWQIQCNTASLRSVSGKKMIVQRSFNCKMPRRCHSRTINRSPQCIFFVRSRWHKKPVGLAPANDDGFEPGPQWTAWAEAWPT